MEIPQKDIDIVKKFIHEAKCAQIRKEVIEMAIMLCCSVEANEKYGSSAFAIKEATKILEEVSNKERYLDVLCAKLGLI